MSASDAQQDAVPNSEAVVLIIDTLPLRSLSLISILNRFDRLAVQKTERVALHTFDETDHGIHADVNCEMLIYNAGSASIRAGDSLERIKALRAIAPDVPMMIFCDNERREAILSALNVDAHGFLYVGTNAELALQAFSFIVSSGSYFASAVRRKRTCPAQSNRAIDCFPTPTSDMGGRTGAAEDLKDAGPRNRLTARQKAVLELLSRGDSNKVIARELGMREGTVKVHVRQIMRKFGVTNRTQAAVICAK